MCTRIFWSGNGVAKVVSRTMDWAVSDEPVLWAVPEGTRRSTRGLTWRSRFGVVGLSMWGAGTTDGVNSAGLAAHLLYQGSAGFAPPDSPGAVPNLLWAQWVLDQYGTVAEAVSALREVSVVSVPMRGQELRVPPSPRGRRRGFRHRSSRQADPRIHHSSEYQVVANERRSPSSGPTCSAIAPSGATSRCRAASSPPTASSGPHTSCTTYPSRVIPRRPWPVWSTSRAQWPARPAPRMRTSGSSHVVGVGHRPHQPDLLLLVTDEPRPDLGRASPDRPARRSPGPGL